MKFLTLKLAETQSVTFSKIAKAHFLKSVDYRPALDGVSVLIWIDLDEAQTLVDSQNLPVWLIEKIDEASFSAGVK